MDPITGIGLAASVIQLVHFGINAPKPCQQIYQQGSTSGHVDADFIAGHLTALTSSLQQSLQSTGTRSSALSKEEKDLIELGHKCQDCARKLQHELHKLQARPRESALEVTCKAARSL